MEFFAAYLRGRRSKIAVFAVFCLIFLCIFWLYRLPVGAVLYPAGICAVLGGILLVRDFLKAYKKHRRLKELAELPAELMDRFPEADCFLDTDYQEIVRVLLEQYVEQDNKMNARLQDMMDYYAVWAHQIKTPIASMRLNLRNEDTALSRKISDDLFRIEQYVEMALTFLRLDSDTTDYVIRTCDLDSIVTNAVKKFAGQFIRAKIRLEYSPLDVQVLTDEKWLSFVVEQVLSNALKYTYSGTVTIDLEEPKTLCIRDTGIGIAPEDLPRIFEKGYTGYNGRSHRKASGIGLYLCRRICLNLGHGITANSSPGSGTVIRIFLEHRKLEVE